MSDTQTAGQDGGTGGRPPPDDAALQARARRLGWRPREEFTGDAEKWVSHEEFLDRGVSDPRILAHNLETLDRRYERLERDFRNVSDRFTQSQKEQQESTELVRYMSTQLKTADQRAFERAKRELEAERTRAVETGDVPGFQKADAQLAELAKTAPPDPPKPQTPANLDVANAGGANAPGPRQLTAGEQEIVDRFYADNPWYNADPELRLEADGIHIGLLNTRRDLDLGRNLAETARRVKALHAEKFRTAASANNGAGQGDDVDNDGNPRRSEPGAVNSSAGGGSHRAPRNRWGFDTLPKVSKDAYVRYKRMLDGKGEALTEKEWAHDYYLQEQEYVDHLERNGQA